MKPQLTPLALVLLASTTAIPAAEFHVATNGSDGNPGTRRSPFRTIQRAAERAQAGDVITVHAGVYRERVNPPRGGLSDRQRIIYQAARGAHVEIKGSEVIKGWVKQQAGVWKVTLPNAFFGRFNPYTNIIRGDWFNGRGREHHTGAVYLNGEWLTEAVTLDEVLLPAGQRPDWLTRDEPHYLMNIAWLQLGPEPNAEARIPATRFAAQQGVEIVAGKESDKWLGKIEHGDWTAYDGVDFGTGTEQVQIRAASSSRGGVIELRLGTPAGELLGTADVVNTGDWQAGLTFPARIKPIRGVQQLCLVFKHRDSEVLPARSVNPRLWYARVDADHTTLWAQFGDADPNAQLVEVNVRQSVFYPDQPGRNFITVRRFALRQAATPWAPPTAEQIGLLGTHWSRGWIIEDNVISHSVCTGITLGKHGDAHDNTSADTAEGYVKTIERAHAHPLAWTREQIGHHLVRRNTISHCEQAGVVGSLGAAFSTIEGNVVHDIHVRRLFTGAEMAGVKIHAAIDASLRRNRIFRTHRGLWLDWMAQGTRVSDNLFYENASEDLFVEVNHGPFVVDNNLFLSPTNLRDMSQGGTYAHNLFAGSILNRPEPDRGTPYHPAHSTTVAGLAITTGGDNRFYNNLFVGDGRQPPPAPQGDLAKPRWISSHGLWGYDERLFPLRAGGNVYYWGAQPYAQESNALVLNEVDPTLQLSEQGDEVRLSLALGRELRQATTTRVNTELLGRARISGLPYVNPDGSPLTIDRDYFGQRRGSTHPTPGPFQKAGPDTLSLRVW